MKKMIIQSAEEKDYKALRKLALKYPLLNLPAKESLLKKKIEQSLKSFAKLLPKEKRIFLFILKTKEGELIASSQIFSKSATKSKPSYSLKIQKFLKNQSESVLENLHNEKAKTKLISEAKSFLKNQNQSVLENQSETFLKLKITKTGPTYLGGLIVAEKWRGRPEKAGKQISLIRFLFAGMRPKCFESTFLAELAPFLDEQGKNPFFEKFIYPRLKLSMEEIDYMTLTAKEKLFKSYPREKILLSSLPESIRKTLGKPGLLSARAEALLLKQNFAFAGEVDPFDGGPYMQANRKDIPIISNTKPVQICFKSFRRAESFRRGDPLKKPLKNPELFERSDYFKKAELFEKSDPLKKPLKNPELFERSDYFKKAELLERSDPCKKTKKYLWGKIKQDQFIGGTIEGVLKEKTLYVLEESAKESAKESAEKSYLAENEQVFISPFE